MSVRNTKGFTIVEVVLGILVLALAGYITWMAINTASHKQDKQPEKAKTETKKEETVEKELSWKRIESGAKAFSVQIPDGWGEVLRPADSDMLVIMGQTQPTLKEGVAATVKDLAGFGTDAPSLLTVMVYNNLAEPRGTATDFAIGDLKGKKYTYVTPADTERGLGQEDAGDKLYDYRFELSGGKQLAVFYHVYVNTDSRDQVEIVDKIVKSIKLAQ